MVNSNETKIVPSNRPTPLEEALANPEIRQRYNITVNIYKKNSQK
jgi:hypothetical protein